MNNFQRYIHKYINSGINITVERFVPFIEQCATEPNEQNGAWVEEAYEELIGVTADSIALYDSARSGEDKEFYELQKHYSLTDVFLRFKPEFNSFESLFNLRPQEDNKFLLEYITQEDNEQGDWLPIYNLKHLFCGYNCEQFVPGDKKYILFKTKNYQSLRITDPDELYFELNENCITARGVNANIVIRIYDFLTLLKINVYAI
jgi:hypothetical protein